MEVEVLSSQTIKPLWPTPKHQRTYKLNLCDQLTLFGPIYIPVVLFYSSPPTENRKTISDQLKQSLSEALTYFYPFAGRVKDCFTLDCNDEGVVFIETEVYCDMSVVVKDPEMRRLLQLLPFHPHDNLPSDPTAMIMAAIQVNNFACGGIAIGVCISHVIADMSAMATFLNSWAAIASGIGTHHIDLSNVIHNSAAIFTPQDFSNALNLDNKNGTISYVSAISHVSEGKAVTKRFVFEGPKITCLRNEIGNNASRFEAIMALIWAAMIEIAGKEDKNLPSVTTMAMNLRNRLNPPFPQQCIGNVVQIEILKSPTEKSKINVSSLSAIIRESVRKVDDGYIKKLIADGEFLNVARHGFKTLGKNLALIFSSFCRFPLYEIDFGWGKPIWLVSPWWLNGIAVFWDTSDGQGIEVWLTLEREKMAKLEQDPSILTYATFKPSI